MSWPIKLELNPINGLSANVWKLFNESEARTWQEFSGMWPKVYLADEDHNELAHQIWAKSDPRFLAATKQLYDWFSPSVCLSVCHYKKSLLRSQIYHGYEELSTDTNYPIWRRQKLPYMKKTRKKKQVCGAACFMAAEIKFSEDVRPSASWQLRSNSPKTSVCLSHLFHHVPIIISSWNFQELLPMTKVTSMQKVKVRGQRSRSQRSTPNLTVSGL